MTKCWEKRQFITSCFEARNQLLSTPVEILKYYNKLFIKS